MLFRSKLVDEIEAEIYHAGKAEISSTLIGDMVMEKLKLLDYIAYIRFASVYREFADIKALKEAVDNLVVIQKDGHRVPGQLPLIPENKTEEPPRGSKAESKNKKSQNRKQISMTEITESNQSALEERI